MRQLLILLCITVRFYFNSYGQTEIYNLKSQNLHKNVRKVISHYYGYDSYSGGFVKRSVDIKRYNNQGNLVETYYLYNGTYSESAPIKKLYNYNEKGLLLGTKDISDKKGKYSNNFLFSYDKKNNLIKRESHYKDGSKYFIQYTNDKRGNLVHQKEYNKSNNLIAEVNYTYKGSKKTTSRTSFSSKDGSIIGTYTTIFEDGNKTLYKSNNTYDNSTTTYKYDRKGNLLQSNSKGKTDTSIKYDYIYDKKDNWIKKHYRSGKYQYFYFREIHFENGDVTGSTNFDPKFVNSLGNFPNTDVVPLKKKTNTTNNNTSNNVVTNSSYITSKFYNFDYVYSKQKVKKLSGTLKMSSTDGSVIKYGSNVDVNIKFNGEEFNLKMTVSSFTTTDKGNYEWKMKNQYNDSALFRVYKTTKLLRDNPLNVSFNVNGFFKVVDQNNVTTGFYLK